MTAKNARTAPGATLRAAASALGLSRKKLLRFIGDGLPVTRHGERVYLDLETARDWIALNDTGEAKLRKSALLHPDDPRYRDRLAAAEIRRIEFAIEHGHAVSIEEAGRRLDDNLARCRSALVQIPNRVAFESVIRDDKDIELFISEAVEAALLELKIDDPSEWPTPGPWLEPSPDVPNTDGDDRDVLPVLAATDPRFILNDVKAAEREARLTSLQRTTVPVPFVIEKAAEDFNAVRTRLRSIPSRVMKLAKKSSDVPLHMIVEHEINSALCELGGHPKPPPLQPELETDDDEFEDVDGSAVSKLEDENAF